VIRLGEVKHLSVISGQQSVGGHRTAARSAHCGDEDHLLMCGGGRLQSRRDH
jgi:hypothetical protein